MFDVMASGVCLAWSWATPAQSFQCEFKSEGERKDFRGHLASTRRRDYNKATLCLLSFLRSSGFYSRVKR